MGTTNEKELSDAAFIYLKDYYINKFEEASKLKIIDLRVIFNTPTYKVEELTFLLLDIFIQIRNNKEISDFFMYSNILKICKTFDEFIFAINLMIRLAHNPELIDAMELYKKTKNKNIKK